MTQPGGQLWNFGTLEVTTFLLSYLWGRTTEGDDDAHVVLGFIAVTQNSWYYCHHRLLLQNLWPIFKVLFQNGCRWSTKKSLNRVLKNKLLYSWNLSLYLLFRALETNKKSFGAESASFIGCNVQNEKSPHYCALCTRQSSIIWALCFADKLHDFQTFHNRAQLSSFQGPPVYVSPSEAAASTASCRGARNHMFTCAVFWDNLTNQGYIIKYY